MSWPATCSGEQPASERLPVRWSSVSWSVDATGAAAAVVAVEVVVVADTGVRFCPAGHRSLCPTRLGAGLSWSAGYENTAEGCRVGDRRCLIGFRVCTQCSE